VEHTNNYINRGKALIFQLDAGIKRYFAGVTGFSLGTSPANSDIIIASNAWAFRDRILQKGSLVFPFINYRILPGGISRPESTFPKNYSTAVQGVWDDDLQDRVRCLGFTARYEATLWSTSFANTMSIFQKFYMDNFDDNLVQYSYVINGSTLQFNAPLEYTNLEFDPQWEAQKEIESGKIHSIDLSFQIQGFMFHTRGNHGLSGAQYNKAKPCVVTSAAHGLTTKNTVTISGSTSGEIDGTFRVYVIDANHFSLDGTDTTSGSGGYCDWYSGVKPVDQLELDLFYNNGVMGTDTPDRTLVFPEA
jgi:hypothetical protein